MKCRKAMQKRKKININNIWPNKLTERMLLKESSRYMMLSA